MSGVLAATLAVQPARAAPGGGVIEVVTFKLKPGVTAAEFAPIDKAVEREHVAKQPGFVSRESATIEHQEQGGVTPATGRFPS